MKKFLKTSLLGLAVGVSTLLFPMSKANAQVSVGIGIGEPGYMPAPACEWGYAPEYPFNCVGQGYWGPEYFNNGVFIGFPGSPWWGGRFNRGYYRPGYRVGGIDRGHANFRGGGTRSGAFHGGGRGGGHAGGGHGGHR